MFLFFFYQGFLSQTLTILRTVGEGGDHRLFDSTTSICSRTLKHLFAALHVRWLSRIFNHNTCFLPDCYFMRFATLSNYHLINDAIIVCLLDELSLGFCYSDFDIYMLLLICSVWWRRICMLLLIYMPW